MSINVISLQGGHHDPLIHFYLDPYYSDPNDEQKKLRFVQEVFKLAASHYADTVMEVPKPILGAIGDWFTVDGSIDGLGRCGLRPITSVWAKEKYPLAKWEVVITLTPPNGAVHVFLVFL